MQFQADILGVPVQRNATPELSALGAAYLAGLAVGTWASTDEIAALPRTFERFKPSMESADRVRLYDGSWRARPGPGDLATFRQPLTSPRARPA